MNPKREKVTSAWRKLHNEGLHISCSLSDMKGLTRDDGLGRVRSTYDRCDKCVQNFSLRKMKGGDDLGDVVINQCSGIVWNASLWNRAQISLGCCEYGNEPEGV
jgi:hypothetical protein